MILKNKLTRESLEITYPEFRKKFAKELEKSLQRNCKQLLKVIAKLN